MPLNKAKLPVRLGDYLVVQLVSGEWVVRHALIGDVLSSHQYKGDALAAAKRYVGGDKRRHPNAQDQTE